MLGNSTDALIQGVITFGLGFIIQIPLDLLALPLIFPLMLLITFGLVCIGLTIASSMGSLESFGVIQSFVTLPIFFLSGALFPLTSAPAWLQAVSYFNPMTYGVDALRTVILGSAFTPLFPLYIDILAICGFDLAMIGIGTLAFSRRR
jgi:ABC-2 type transport system permease protein